MNRALLSVLALAMTVPAGAIDFGAAVDPLMQISNQGGFIRVQAREEGQVVQTQEEKDMQKLSGILGAVARGQAASADDIAWAKSKLDELGSPAGLAKYGSDARKQLESRIPAQVQQATLSRVAAVAGAKFDLYMAGKPAIPAGEGVALSQAESEQIDAIVEKIEGGQPVSRAEIDAAKALIAKVNTYDNILMVIKKAVDADVAEQLRDVPADKQPKQEVVASFKARQLSGRSKQIVGTYARIQFLLDTAQAQ